MFKKVLQLLVDEQVHLVTRRPRLVLVRALHRRRLQHYAVLPLLVSRGGLHGVHLAAVLDGASGQVGHVADVQVGLGTSQVAQPVCMDKYRLGNVAEADVSKSLFGV